MFKKTLLALALTGLAGTATAGTVNAGGSLDKGVNAVSVEGAVGTSSEKLDGVTFTISDSKKADYASLKTIVVDITGATLSPATAAELTLSSAPDALDPTLVEVSYPTSTQVKFDVLENSAFTDDATDAGLEDGAVFTVNGLDLVFASKEAGAQVSYTVTAQSSVGGAEIDKGTAVVTEFVTQFSAKVDPKLGSNKVDVAQGRMLFSATTAAATKADSATVAIESEAVDLLGASIVADTYNFALNGDFSFLDVDGDDEVDSEFTLSGTVADDLQSTAVTKANAASATFDFETDGSVVLPVQAFSADASVQYTTAAGSTQTFETEGLYAGAWVLNGSSDTVSFLPFGSQYAQSVTVTNRGTVEGAITIELTANGEVESKELAKVAGKNTITDISKEVAAFAAEQGITGNASLKVIVDAPDANISTDAVYYSKADADRVKTY